MLQVSQIRIFNSLSIVCRGMPEETLFEFERDMDAGKARLVDGESGDRDGVHVREVPADAEAEAEMAARVCPVDAIALVDDDGERVVP